MTASESPDDLDTRITTPVTDPLTPLDPVPAWTGRSVGRYLVLEPLGSGGMGEVYLAYDPQLDRRVAFKVLRRDRHATRDAQDRLLREAQALARLSHPNVVAVHDVGVVEVGTVGPPAVYVAMEYVEGETLRAWASERADWRAIARAYHGAGLGLAAAHAVGIVHRDFKPTNVIVGAGGRARVLDFGLARRVDDGPLVSPEALDDSLDRSSDGPDAHASVLVSSRDSSLTETGIVLGTPAYMAPEQFTGADVDARGDQFSFCVALYEALLGVRPFGGREPGKIVREIRRQQFREPKGHAGIPARLRAALRKGLAYAPGDRHADMNALLAEIDAVLRPLPRAVLGAAGLGVVAAAGVWWVSSRAAPAVAPDPCQGAEAALQDVWNPGQRDRVRAAFAGTELAYAREASDKAITQIDTWADGWTVARTEACVATRVRGDQSADLMDLRVACLDDRLGHLGALVDALGHADREIVENAVQSVWGLPAVAPCSDARYLRAAVRPPDDPAVAAEVAKLRTDLAQALATMAVGKYVEGAKEAEHVLERVREVDYEPLHAEAALATAQAFERGGRLDEVRALFEEALYAAERSGYGRVEAESLIGLTGYVGYQSADLEGGMRYGDHARAVVDRLQRPDAFVAALEVAVANSLVRAGKIAEAVPHYETALALPSSSPSSRRHNLAAAVNVATAYAMLGDDRAALTALEVAAERTRLELGAGHPTYGTAVMNIGATHWRMGSLEEADASLAEASRILEAALGPDHPQMARVLHNQGAVLRDQGRLAEALEHYDRALSLKRKLLGTDHPSVALTANNIGDVLLEQGRYDDAARSLLDAIHAWETSVGPEHPEIAIALSTLGRVRLAQRRAGEAVELLERASKLRDASASPRDLWEQNLAFARALLAAGGDRGRALELALDAQRQLARAPRSTPSERAEVAALVRKLGGNPSAQAEAIASP